jgi:hypothetical protein
MGMVQVAPFVYLEADTVVEVEWPVPRNPLGPKVWSVQADDRRYTFAEDYAVSEGAGDEERLTEMEALMTAINNAKTGGCKCAS